MRNEQYGKKGRIIGGGKERERKGKERKKNEGGGGEWSKPRLNVLKFNKLN